MGRSVKKLLSNRWLLGALGFLAAALVIWFVGQLLAFGDWRPLESVFARLVAILLVGLGWVGLEFMRFLRARKANAQLLEGIAGDAGDDAQMRSGEEVALLRSRMREAVETLKQARFGGGKSGSESRFLYELPWYVFIGAPGSGKTTALVNSGLSFPLAEGGAVSALKGVGGTRNCDWWFTDEAVLLDTAGRYTTQDSEQKVDASAWLGFLELLKRQRPRSPLNGAIITVSVSDLLGQSEVERARYASTVRTRVQELYSKLGVAFPLYVLVTKIDLLAGANEFFADLGAEERGQVWGITFPLPAAGATFDIGSAYAAEAHALADRLNGRLLTRLNEERDFQRRALVYNFPQQFSALEPLLRVFLEQAFGASRYDQKPMVRGVYFSSGTQEGTPIDRVLGTLSRALNLERKMLPPSRSSGKSFFITRLMKDIVFREAGLVGADERRERRLKLAARAGFAAIGAASLAALVAWGVSYTSHAGAIADAGDRAQAVAALLEKLPQPAPEDWATALPALNALRDLAGAGGTRPAAGWSNGYGLFVGNKLATQADRAYQRALKDAFLPRMALALEAQMGRSLNEPERLYEWLKAYLMLYADKHVDPRHLEEVMKVLWARNFPRETGTQAMTDLAGHLGVVLANRPIEVILPRDEALVDESRRRLATLPLADRVYARLRLAGLSGAGGQFRISEAAGPAAAQVFVRASKQPLTQGIPAFFSAEGYKQVLKGGVDSLAKDFAAEESWVIGEKYQTARGVAGAAQLLDQVQKRYFDEYIRVWDEYLRDVRLAPTASLRQTVEFTQVLASPDSPLRRLVVAAAKEVSLSPEPAKPNEQKSGMAGTVGRVLSGVIGDPAAKVAEVARRPESAVDNQFAGLRNFVAAGAGKSPLDALGDRLAEFYAQLVAYESSRGQGGTTMSIGPAAAGLRAEAGRAPPPISTVLVDLAARAEGRMSEELRKDIAGGAAGAAPTCRIAIPNRYPFSQGSAQDVPLADFAKVFGPAGELSTYFSAKLQPEVDMSTAQWRPRQGSQVPAEVIFPFQRAAAIRDAFFPSGGQPGFAVDLVLVSADPSIAEVVLETEGQVLRFATSRKDVQRVQWPGPKPGSGARLALAAAPGAPAAGGLAAEGNWALFRLVDRARVEQAGGPERLRLSFSVDAKPVVLELRAGSVRNPFALRDLQSFRCPG